ncbi:hypothetical protein B0H10DRAFT_1978341 [Mycena sp. CBHHK59/15]|nr:hypothetical protein B0H10DRAFT_1978341 [Mycena sp. CBHHK59/15]
MLGRKILQYIPEMYDPPVKNVADNGRFYTWDDPTLLDYVPLPPPPRKDVKCGRVLSKPKRGPDVCA